MEIETDYEPVEIVPTTRQQGKYKLVKCARCGEFFPVESHATGPRKLCDDCQAVRLKMFEAIQKSSALRKAEIRRRKEEARERQIRRVQRDLEYQACNIRVTVAIVDGKRIECRGTVPGDTRCGIVTAFFNPVNRYLYKP